MVNWTLLLCWLFFRRITLLIPEICKHNERSWQIRSGIKIDQIWGFEHFETHSFFAPKGVARDKKLPTASNLFTFYTRFLYHYYLMILGFNLCITLVGLNFFLQKHAGKQPIFSSCISILSFSSTISFVFHWHYGIFYSPRRSASLTLFSLHGVFVIQSSIVWILGFSGKPHQPSRVSSS